MASTPTLWSIQHQAAYDALCDTGVLRSNPDFVDPCLQAAYTWMATQLGIKVPRPAGCTALYPVWAWFQYQGPASPRPKLSDEALLPSGEQGVLIEFRAPPSTFLLSDFQKWHAVLNENYLPLNNQEQRTFDAWVTTLEAGEADPAAQRTIKQSWPRIFDLTCPGTDCWEEPMEREIQAVLWQIRIDWVLKATPFIAR